MSEPIRFRGTEYASVEVMPPDVREMYEKVKKGMAQLQRGLEEMQQGIDRAGAGVAQANSGAYGQEPGSPAWGGLRAPGAVPVPVEFDPVTGLGPAAAVHLHDGIKLFPDFGTPHAKVLVIYHDGFAFQSGKDIHAWRWEEVAVIVSKTKMNSGEHGGVWTEHEYTLTRTNGEKVILDDGLKTIEDAIDPIKKNVFAHLLPPLAQQYRSGQALTFGPLTIQQQNGLQMDGKLYAWAAIMDIKVERGRFTVTLRDTKHHEVHAAAVPNIELLSQIIGVKFYEPSLAYF